MNDEPLVPGRQRFPREERLTRKSDYLHVYQNGDKRVGHAFICYQLRRAGQGRKLGCAVSRKVGDAVVRNRVKRYLREIYRKNRDRIEPDTYCVFVARPRCAAMNYHDCETAIRQLLRRGAPRNE